MNDIKVFPFLMDTYKKKIHQYLTLSRNSNLVKTSMEDFFYLSSFKGDTLKVSFVVVGEECQTLPRVCGRLGEMNMMTYFTDNIMHNLRGACY